MIEIAENDQKLLEQYPYIRIVGYDENFPVSSAELELLAAGLVSGESSGIVKTHTEPTTEEPFIIPESIGNALAANLLGIERVSDTNNNTVLSESNEANPVITEPNSIFEDLKTETPRQLKADDANVKPSIKRPGFLRRNAKKIGAVVAASVFAVAAFGGLKNLDKDNDSPDKTTTTNLPEATTTVAQVQPSIISTVPTILAPASVPETPSVVTATEVPPAAAESVPSATVDTQDPNQIVEVIKIQPGRESWVWNIVQSKLTGSFGGENNSNIKIVRATLRVISAIANDNGFGDDTSKLSQMSPGYNLTIRSGTAELIEYEKAQLFNASSNSR